MSELVDGLALPFERFVVLADPRWGASCTISFVHPQHSHSVHLIGSIANEVPANARLQRFDEQYLLPIANELGLDLKKTAILMALRNAWIAYFQETKIPKISVNEIRLLMTNEIATDYVVLTSEKWSEHPWIRDQINQSQAEELPASTLILENPGCEIHHRIWIEEQDAWEEMQKDNIHFCINKFRQHRGGYTSFLEVDADSAQYDIKDAKKRIAELHVEVEKQEAIIREAARPIRKFQNHERALKKRAPGRPKISEMKEQQERRDIATKFVARWIGSLMDELSITSCGELAKMVGGQKMTWWRWQNGKTLPPLRYLEPLLDVEIKSGKHRSTKLRDLQSTPALVDLIALIDLV